MLGIVLTTDTDKLRAVMDGAAATTNPDFVVALAQMTTGTAFEKIDRTHGTLNGTTNVDLCAGVASKHIAVRNVSIYNRDTASVMVTIKLDVSGTERTVAKFTLGVGESAHFSDAAGWYVLNALGERKGVGATGADGADGADGAVAVVEATVPFGATMADESSVAVSNAAFSASSLFLCQLNGGSTTDNDAETHAFLAQYATVVVVPSDGTATFTVSLADGVRAVGDVKIRYTFS